jgi:2,4-dienoyl-CoA reductase-like NADH-dependent reductase (Old Yellow Enzyme family)
VPIAEGGWEDVIAPSAIPFAGNYPHPREMTADDLAVVRAAFVAAATRAKEAGFQYLEVHAAHGYLLHAFLSPLANQRMDVYGGSLANRMRFVLEVAGAVREVWPAQWPLAVRISSTDWVPGGWTIDDSVTLARALHDRGVDLIVASSGGTSPQQQIVLSPGYQVPFAARIRHEADIPTMAVGLITEPEQAEAILAAGQADLIALARQFLHDPYWPLHAALALGVDLPWPDQYARGKPSPELHPGQRPT